MLLGDISDSVYLVHWPLIIIVPSVTGHLLSWPEKLGILAATPVLSGTGVAAILETRIGDVFRAYLTANSERYRVRGGPAALYVAINGAIYVVLKWLSERPAFISREALVDALVTQLDVLLIAS